MAWVENEIWEVEQGIDGLKIFELFEDEEQEIPWQFTGWDVNATISNEEGKKVSSITVDADPENGIIKLILPELIINSLRLSDSFRYDCLLVSGGPEPADDHFVASGPLKISLRSTRRDP